MSDPHTTASNARPRAASVAASILFVEALGMVALAVWIGISSLGDPVSHIAGGLFLAVLAAASAVFLLLAGRAMLDGKAWARSASVVWQVLQLGVALGTFNGGEGPIAIAIVLAALSIAGLVTVLRSSVTAWLRREH